jgi:quinol monooxygenase YgiN
MMLLFFRTVVTVIVVGTMALMIFSLRNELKSARQQLAALKKAQKEGVYVLCRFDLKPEADLAAYQAKTLGIIPQVLAEDGCQFYTLLKDARTDWDRPMRFGERTLWMLEKWDSVEALKKHLDAPHMKAFGPTVRDMRRSATFHVLEEVR